MTDHAPTISLESMQQALGNLEQALVNRVPEMPNLLRRIHTDLKQCPELLHLLEPEQVAVLVKGLSIQTGVVIQAATARSDSKKEREGLKNLTLDDI